MKCCGPIFNNWSPLQQDCCGQKRIWCPSGHHIYFSLGGHTTWRGFSERLARGQSVRPAQGPSQVRTYILLFFYSSFLLWTSGHGGSQTKVSVCSHLNLNCASWPGPIRFASHLPTLLFLHTLCCLRIFVWPLRSNPPVWGSNRGRARQHPHPNCISSNTTSYAPVFLACLHPPGGGR